MCSWAEHTFAKEGTDASPPLFRSSHLSLPFSLPALRSNPRSRCAEEIVRINGFSLGFLKVARGVPTGFVIVRCAASSDASASGSSPWRELGLFFDVGGRSWRGGRGNIGDSRAADAAEPVCWGGGSLKRSSSYAGPTGFGSFSTSDGTDGNGHSVQLPSASLLTRMELQRTSTSCFEAKDEDPQTEWGARSKDFTLHVSDISAAEHEFPPLLTQ